MKYRVGKNDESWDPFAAGTDLAVLKPFNHSQVGYVQDLHFSRWLAEFSPRHLVIIALLFCLWPGYALAQSNYSFAQAMDALWRWLPFIVSKGFLLNLIVSFLTMLIGTIAGVLLGLGQISLFRPLAHGCWFVTQIFRNSPWLVLLFIVMLAFPFEIQIGGRIYPIPDWLKAVLALALPIMANISEIVRGAVRSLPTDLAQAPGACWALRHLA